MSITMTTRQFTMLDMVSGDGKGISVDNALELNQVTFGSVCYRDWVKFDPHKRKFVLSRTGKDVYSANRNLDLHRATNTGEFGVRVGYHGPAQGIRSSRKKKDAFKETIAARKEAIERAERREEERGRLEAEAHQLADSIN